MTIIDFNTLAEWFILAIVAIVGAYSIGELANLLVTTRAINAIQNTSSSAINALVSVHNISTIANQSNNSQKNTSSYVVKEGDESGKAKS